MTADHPTRSPDSPDHLHGPSSSTNSCPACGSSDSVRTPDLFEWAKQAVLDAGFSLPLGPDGAVMVQKLATRIEYALSVRTPDLLIAQIRERHSLSDGRLHSWDTCPDEDHPSDLHDLLAALHPASPPQEGEK
jgi:hypothetical protein